MRRRLRSLARPSPRRPRAADCGPVEVELDRAGRTLVRLSDIVYRLALYGEQLGISMFHGTMQVDGFFAPYRWSGPLLQFTDTEKPRATS